MISYVVELHSTNVQVGMTRHEVMVQEQLPRD